ncbi:putative entry exclusion protein TrbK-alt [Pelagibacterium lentulum]|uniref:Conjugative transfer region protein TrbK n=1 Tax=Pelagibacterium lentulum TaxID=2029865 RepID=A0A916RAM1_9HYPH|nr:putative entry exclusion protein TrbK-alt [Pelagibacterium lentulum]GGA48643.1 hypothetical protein GCM10011499_18060 [Pelagibacterium lentulum]
MIIRIAAIVFIALAATFAAIEMVRKNQATPLAQPSPSASQAPRPDLLREQLIHCQAMGASAASEPDCLEAWAQNRQRFLGQDSER